MLRRGTSKMILLIGIVMCVLISGCSGEQGTNGKEQIVELTVSAAASLTDALKEIQQAFESQHTGITLHMNIGSSGALKQQIDQGAPVDLFISASPNYMQDLVDSHMIDSNNHLTLLTNSLVVVIPAEDAVEMMEMTDLLKAEVKTVAIGIPDSVPAGDYARQSLENADLWDQLQAKIVQAKDVRQVLQYVETGNADAGFVYRTDAITSDQVSIAFSVDEHTYTPVEYPIGLVAATKHDVEAKEFYDFLQTTEALDIFKSYGFTTAEAE